MTEKSTYTEKKSPIGNTPRSTYWIIHLEDEKDDRERIEGLLPQIREVFSSVFDEVLGPPGGASVFSPALELVQAKDLEKFSSLLWGSDGTLTEEAENCVLFLLDYYIGDSELFDDATVDGVPFVKYITTLFPSTPKMLLTTGGGIDIPADHRFQYMNKGVYLDAGEEAGDFKKSLRRKFKKEFTPPFWSELLDYAMEGDDSWHTPGHNSGNAFERTATLRGFYEAYQKRTFQTDLSVSVPELGDLSETQESSPLTKAQKNSAEVFGAKDTYYVTNGTSTSNRVTLRTLLEPGDTVVVDRNCHKSVHQAIAMAGAIPAYLPPKYNSSLGIWKPTGVETIREYLSALVDEGIEPRVVILTTCTYEGALYPIRDIAAMCERHGILFYADEAWAPYLRFHPHYVDREDGPFPYSAMEGGAHIAVQSTHKALAAFSQASMIHVSGKFRKALKSSKSKWDWLNERFGYAGTGDYSAFRHSMNENLRYSHSTSPFYPILASLDCASIQMRVEGRSLIGERIRWAQELESEVESLAPGSVVGLEAITEGDSGYSRFMKDPLKVVLQTPTAHKKDQFRNALEENNIKCEKTTSNTIQFLVTLGTQLFHIELLKRFIRDHADALGPPDTDTDERAAVETIEKGVQGELGMLPRTAVLTEGQTTPLAEAEGRIASQMITPFPPGIPVVIPGIRISASMIALVENAIDQGGLDSVHGIYRHNRNNLMDVVPSDEVEVEDEVAEKIGKINRLTKKYNRNSGE